jgi:hypothetical protein
MNLQNESASTDNSRKTTMAIAVAGSCDKVSTENTKRVMTTLMIDRRRYLGA